MRSAALVYVVERGTSASVFGIRGTQRQTLAGQGMHVMIPLSWV